MGQPVHIYGFYSDLEEAAGVAKKVLSLNRYDHVSWNEIAILYRTNAQSRTFEDAFRKLDIPYRVYGGTSFYQRKEIKDVIAYFRLAVNPNDEESLRRVINYPARGIGQTTVQRVAEAAQAAGVSPWQVVSAPEAFNTGISGATAAKLRAFTALIQSFGADVVLKDAATLGKRIATESGVVAEVFRGREPEDISRQENLQELLDGMQQFVDERQEEEGSNRIMLSHYLQEISLISDLDESDDDSEEKLSLMTVHSAKGLEFRTVFIVGMEEDLFPNQMASSSPRGLEEERRLFYVAVTRAEELCYITYAKNRYHFGRPEICKPSSFIAEIDKRFVDANDADTSARKPLLSRPRSSFFTSDEQSGLTFQRQAQHPQASSFAQASPYTSTRSTSFHTIAAGNVTPQQSAETPEGKLVVGTRIEHARFGRGTVTALAGTGIDARATVSFDNVGTKQLLLRFAKFAIIE